MKTIRIYNYEILNFDAQPTVFSNAGFTRITDPRLTKVLQHIAESHLKYMPEDELKKILEHEELQSEKAIRF